MTMKKYVKKIVGLTICAMLLVSVTACEGISNGNQSTPENTTSSAVESSGISKGEICGKIIDDIKNYCHLSDMQDIDKEQLFSLYGIKDEYVAYFAGIKSSSSVSKDEAIVIQAMEEGSACSVRDCLQNHYDKILKESQEYLPDEYEKIKNSKVVKDGIYVYLFISDENDKMEDIYKSYDK